MKLEPGQDLDILCLRFSAWGSQCLPWVEQDEKEVTSLLKNVFSVMAEKFGKSLLYIKHP